MGMAAALLLAGTPALADDAAIYKASCARCHGDNGKSDTSVGKSMKVPPLAGDAEVQKMSEADIAARVKENKKHPKKVKSLSDADIAAAAAYAKKLAGTP
jgi:mono/diheme cytochrome c family protein